MKQPGKNLKGIECEEKKTLDSNKETNETLGDYLLEREFRINQSANEILEKSPSKKK